MGMKQRDGLRLRIDQAVRLAPPFQPTARTRPERPREMHVTVQQERTFAACAGRRRAQQRMKQRKIELRIIDRLFAGCRRRPHRVGLGITGRCHQLSQAGKFTLGSAQQVECIKRRHALAPLCTVCPWIRHHQMFASCADRTVQQRSLITHTIATSPQPGSVLVTQSLKQLRPGGSVGI